MNARTFLFLGIFSSMLAGCSQMSAQQTAYYPSTVQSQSDLRVERMRSGNRAAVECARIIGETPHGKIVNSSIIARDDNQSNRLDLIGSKSRLNESQKKALRQFLSDNTRCRELRLDANQGFPSESILRKNFLENDVLYSKLLNNQITIGEFNVSFKRINLATVEELKRTDQQRTQSQQVEKPTGKVIGQGFDNQANGNIFLYDGPCRIDSYRSSYPLRWDAKNASNGTYIGEGCYSLNQQTQQVFLIGPNGKPITQPLANFQGGNNKSFLQSFSEGLQRATTYWNNSAAETQRNTTNLTPGMTSGNNNYTLPGQFNQQRQMNCTTTYYGNQASTTCR